MSGTFGVCDERGNYVQMLWFSSATLSIRAHQRKWVKNETFLKYFRKAFKPAFDMNDKLEDLANGIIPPVKEMQQMRQLCGSSPELGRSISRAKKCADIPDLARRKHETHFRVLSHSLTFPKLNPSTSLRFRLSKRVRTGQEKLIDLA